MGAGADVPVVGVAPDPVFETTGLYFSISLSD